MMANQHHVEQDQEPSLNHPLNYHWKLQYSLDLKVQTLHLLEDLRDINKQLMHLVMRREIDFGVQADN
jgi:hypothetical protein